jgi:hypothetical protein
VIEVSDQPVRAKLTAIEKRIDSHLDRLGIGWIFWLARRILRRATYGSRPGDPTDRMALASAHLTMIAPIEVLELMRKLEVLFQRRPPYDEAWMAHWRAAREEPRSGFREILEG